MAQKVKGIILKDGQEYELIMDWDDIEDKPLLVTTQTLESKNYQSRTDVEQLISEALGKITTYRGEKEEL